MKFVRQSTRMQPKISLILLDWSVRESFHLLHYLERQTLPRDLFEVIIVEYYSRISEAIQPFAEQVDTWLLLEMPETSYYHKHLMYNIGLMYAKGEIIVICDSDAMVKPSFLQTILSHFEQHPNSVLHLDQFRSNCRDFYPFNYPSFEEVIGDGCINYLNGKTSGVVLKDDPLHQRNYGACFCAKREDLIAIGGADEHVDLVGYICGPYDLTFRLLNLGREEIWHEEEFLYHTWHPGQTGTDNYLGPHDGRHVSTTSLEALISRRIEPHVKNQGLCSIHSTSPDLLIHPDIIPITNPSFLESKQVRDYAEQTYQTLPYKGFLIRRIGEKSYEASSLIPLPALTFKLNANSLQEMKKLISSKTMCPIWVVMIIWMLTCYCRIQQVFQKRKEKRQLSQKSQSSGALASPRFAKLKRVFYRVHQLRREVNMLAGFSCDLISTLLLMKKNNVLDGIEIWIGSSHNNLILKALILLKILPSFKINFIDAFNQLEMAGSIKNKAPNAVVTRELYFRYPGWFVPKLDKFMAVL